MPTLSEESYRQLIEALQVAHFRLLARWRTGSEPTSPLGQSPIKASIDWEALAGEPTSSESYQVPAEFKLDLPGTPSEEADY